MCDTKLHFEFLYLRLWCMRFTQHQLILEELHPLLPQVSTQRVSVDPQLIKQLARVAEVII